MPKQVISTGDGDKVVREDTAKAFRGTYWALISVGAFIVITAILFFGGLLKLGTDKTTQQPGQTTNNRPQ